MKEEQRTSPWALLMSGYLWACIAAFALIRFGGGLTNAHLYAAAADVFGLSREIATLLGGAVLLGFALIARFRPRLLNARAICAVSVACQAIMVAVFLLWSSSYPAAALTATVLLRAVAIALAEVLFACSVLKLESLAQVAAVIGFGFLINRAASPLLAMVPSPEAAVAGIAIAGVIVAVFGYHSGKKTLDTLRSGEAADDVELVNPDSFIRSSHGLFFCVMLFSMANGYALTLHEVRNAPLQAGFEGIVIAVLVLYVILVRNKEQEDRLFSFAVLLVVAGLLSAPISFEFADLATVPMALINTGQVAFVALLWMVFVGVGKRNLYAFMPVFGLAECMSDIGITFGAVVGHESNALIGSNTLLAVCFSTLIVFAFFAFLWLEFRTFSFTATINGVQELPVAETPGDDRVSEDGEERQRAEEESDSAFDLSCERIAAEHGLTPRETEIFILLAHGRNGRFIMDHFVISRNTTKSHIKHIYTKLGVHSHQELIDLAERDSRVTANRSL
ncbi:helix-turn-helix domain-containing protein [Curtanaerobium respiraculi]|uniref:helix-turn-helix domain-containing protein n=1 Tax=Curtanaerobium respiraculi TaxID=2949669 RepID=UPI0024B339DD|nr:helix-turn-helix transcriptional regulator [Curtanaerobium respiraculi]